MIDHEQNHVMKKNIDSILMLFFVVIVQLINSSCAYNNIPKETNRIDKNSQRQGVWLESNTEGNEERIILQYYKNGVLNGDYREFFPDGSLAAKGKFKNGVPIGRWEHYLGDGVLTSWQVFDKSGNILRVGTVNLIW